MDKQREQFETWAKGQYTINKDDAGEYWNGFTQDAWEAWQAALAARQPIGDEEWSKHPQTVESKRQWNEVANALGAGGDCADSVLKAALAARQPVAQEPVAHRLVTGDPKRKWMVVQGAPSVGVIRQAQDYGWEVECFYSHTFKPATPPWAAPPAQAVDLGQFRWAVELARQHHSHGSPLNEQVIAECDRLLDLIDSQA